MRAPTSVRVEQAIGSTTFARCDADVFEPGELTITSLDTEQELQVYPPDAWVEATVYDVNGNVLSLFLSPFGQQQAAKRLEAARASIRRAS